MAKRWRRRTRGSPDPAKAKAEWRGCAVSWRREAEWRGGAVVWRCEGRGGSAPMRHRVEAEGRRRVIGWAFAGLAGYLTTTQIFTEMGKNH